MIHSNYRYWTYMKRIQGKNASIVGGDFGGYTLGYMLIVLNKWIIIVRKDELSNPYQSSKESVANKYPTKMKEDGEVLLTPHRISCLGFSHV